MELLNSHFQCFICKSNILEDTVMQVDPEWEAHVSCMKCVKCGTSLDESDSCYVHEDVVYCKKDYLESFIVKCSKCDIEFGNEEIAYSASSYLYHKECFKCEKCTKPIDHREAFIIMDQALFCSEEEFQSWVNMNKDDSPCTSISESSSSMSPSDTKCIKNYSVSSFAGTQIGKSPSKPAERQTRIRTVLNEQQLSVLKQYYAANQKPDAVMKDELVELTGLSPRVIRVWFQNKRCKDKKKVLMDQKMAIQNPESTSGLVLGPGMSVPDDELSTIDMTDVILPCSSGNNFVSWTNSN